MLVISRKPSERVFLDLPSGLRIEVCLVRIDGDKVRLGFVAPPDVAIVREEVARKEASCR